MLLARVIGSVWTTQKEKGMENIKLLITQPLNAKREHQGNHVIAMDRLGAGVGELVLITQGLAAQKVAEEKRPPIDAAIVGIVDSFEVNE
ncbi:EutN/CcmL family microcompartment protein [Pseudobacillus wudalianchiensis]|uniref:Ethanolamine utilization protein EutN n=1 Tax=Pseudobacillus wudalianchiensis TaxID=1743143 RepID=A0A1B9B6M8_9BACI|nr:EutN/CcmL family microcompartment protein [Bacillus wudalianchiensis]OCA91755.1 ethanolamine utilization protein EutN [Bacillus wudalianchiensis]